jgi:hypothetical protein
MVQFAETGWAVVDALRSGVMSRQSATVLQAAQTFVEDFARSLSSVVLARMFLVLPLENLPPAERELATSRAHQDARIGPKTRVLSLLGTYGQDPKWRDRLRSGGHLAVPLLDRAHVQSIPMIAKLLADLEVDLAALEEGRAIASRLMVGGRNGRFLVADAQTAVDEQGRFIIPARDFVTGFNVRTVFGMGGAYVDGTLAVAVIFTNEVIDTLVVDRFPSLISNFKMSTAALLANGHVYS